MLVVVVDVDVVMVVVVEVDVVLVVVSQLLQVLAHWSITESQRLTANKSWHWCKGKIFFLLLHRCVVLVVDVLLLVLVDVVNVLLVVDVLEVVVVSQLLQVLSHSPGETIPHNECLNIV